MQWHLEDIIRDPAIDPVEALALKRRIDRSNQVRTDMVEDLDSYFRDRYATVTTAPDATINTESPAWAPRPPQHPRAQDLPHGHRGCAHRRFRRAQARCAAKLAVLEEQRADLIAAIDTLLDDFAAGRKYMKVYRQMKMYNDPATNPVLYSSGK